MMNRVVKLLAMSSVLLGLFLVACAPGTGAEPRLFVDEAPALPANSDDLLASPAAADIASAAAEIQADQNEEAAGEEDVVTFEAQSVPPSSDAVVQGEFAVDAVSDDPSTSSNGTTTTIQNGEGGPSTEIGPAPGGVPVSSEPGDIAGGGAPGDGSDETNSEEIDVSTWTLYNNNAYGFSIAYPAHFTLRQLADSELAHLKPPSIAAFYFVDVSSSEVSPNLNEPPAFSIRIFGGLAGQAMKDWLETTGLVNSAAGWQTTPYEGQSFRGLSAYSPDFRAPGWFVYAQNNDLVFQLTPLGAEAEAMLQSFRFDN